MHKKAKYSPEVAKVKAEYSKLIARVKKEKEKLRQKWSDISIKEADRATNFQEAVMAYRTAPRGTQARRYAWGKMEEFCATISDVRKYHSVICGGQDSRYRLNDFAEKRWLELSFENIHKATNLKEALSAFENTFSSEVYKEAFIKVLSFCSTYDKLRKTITMWNVSKELNYLYEDKINQLIDEAPNLEEAVRITEGTNCNNKALAKALSFCASREELKKALGWNSPEDLEFLDKKLGELSS